MPDPVTRVVMFCDCHNFSRLMLAIPGPILPFLDRMYTLCGEPIVRQGGRIIKYMGDAILAVFPVVMVAGAVNAAREVRVAYAKLIHDVHTDVESEMEVGLALGPVEEGEVGHPSCRGWDVFGETVNQAAIIGHHLGIAITTEVRERLDTTVRVRPLPPARAKWRTDPLAQWEVVEGAAD